MVALRTRTARGPRLPLIVSVIAALAFLAVCAAAWTIAQAMRPDTSAYPMVEGAEGMEPLVEALDEYYDKEGSYPERVDSLPDFERVDGLQYRVYSSSDGQQYIAGVTGFIGKYVAFTSLSETPGFGDDFGEALHNAGVDDAWAVEYGFAKRPAVSKTYGNIALTSDGVKSIVADPQNPEYVASTTRYPKLASAEAWEDAVRQAGGDPAKLSFSGDLPEGEPRDVLSDDESFTARLLHEGDTWRVKVSWAPVTATGFVLEPLLEQLGEPDLVDESGALGTFLCATATDPDGMAEATACQTNEGKALAWSTTGTYGTGSMIPEALGMSGAGEVWAEENDVILPTDDDIF